MKFKTQYWSYLLVLCLGCEPIFPKSDYEDLGTFGTKRQAQNEAIAHISSRYYSLSPNTYYKVKYTFLRSDSLQISNTHALWFYKDSTTLFLETDIQSGWQCRWSEVDKTILEAAVKSPNSLHKIDSIAKPLQPFARCLYP